MRTPQAEGTAYPKSSDRRHIMCWKSQKKSQMAVVQRANAESGEKKLMQSGA